MDVCRYVVCMPAPMPIQFKQHLIYMYLMIIVVDFCENFVHIEWNANGIEFVCTIEVCNSIQSNSIQNQQVLRFILFYFIYFCCKEDKVHFIIGYKQCVCVYMIAYVEKIH